MILDRINDYLKKSFIELKKVTWLSKKETLRFTFEVIIFSIIFVIIYGIFDSLLVRLLLLVK